MPNYRMKLFALLAVFVCAAPAFAYKHAWTVYEDAKPGAGSCEIVNGGKARCVVVVAENPTRPAQVAAAELVHYVKKMTGVELQIVVDAALLKTSWVPRRILVGESDLTRAYGLRSSDFAPQEYLIQTRGQDLILMGRDAEEYGLTSYEKNGLWPSAGKFGRPHPCFVEMGSLYAVDTFLERVCSVRWYLPGDIGETVPQHKRILAVNLNLREKPWTRYRWSSRRNYRDPFHYFGSSDANKIKTVPGRDMIQFMLRRKMGGSNYACNHSFTTYWSRFGKEHPEWWKEGKPTPQWPHPDYIHPDVIDQAVKDALDYFGGKLEDGRFPEGGRVMASGDYFAVMPNDGRRGLIWSEAARALRNDAPERQPGFSCGWASDFVFTVVDRAARRVYEKHPDKWITCSAYGPYFMPPTTPKKLSPNISIMQCGFLHQAFDETSWKENASNLEQWSRLTKELYVWEYYLEQAFKGHRSFPVVYPRQIAKAIRHMKACDVKGMFIEASAAPSMTSRYSDGLLANPAEDLLNHYVTWTYLCDASRDIERVLNEYYNFFYGPAAAPMKAFFNKIEAAWNMDAPRGVSRNSADHFWTVMCPPSELPKYKGLIEKARELAGDREPYASRVRLMDGAVYRRMEKNCLSYAARFAARPRLYAPIAKDAPTIDGKLDDAFWKSAPVAGPLTRLSVDALPAPTTARAAFTADALCVSFSCGGAPEKGDCAELFLDPGRTRLSYLRVTTTPDGKTRARTCSVDSKGKLTETPWKEKLQCVAIRSRDGWTVEAAIPLASLKTELAVGDVWGINFSRASAEGKTLWWSTPGEKFTTAHTLGVLLAGVPAPEDGPRAVVALDFEKVKSADHFALDAGEGLTLEGKPVRASAALRRTGKNSKPWDASAVVEGVDGSGLAFVTANKRYIIITLPKDFGLDRDDFTFSMWYKTDKSPGGGSLAGSTTSKPYWGLGFLHGKENDEFRFALGASAQTSVAIGKAAPAPGQWRYLVVTVDRGGMVVMYLDGARIAAGNMRAHTDALKNVITLAGPYNNFEGALDRIRVYKGTLGPDKVAAIYKAYGPEGGAGEKPTVE